MASAISTSFTPIRFPITANNSPFFHRIFPLSPIKKHPYIANKWIQLSLIISSLAFVTFQSALNQFPASIFFAAKCVLIPFSIIELSLLTIKIVQIIRERPSQESISLFDQEIRSLPPLISCVGYPAVEEIFNRVPIQGGLGLFLKNILPNKTLPFFGASLPIWGLSTIVISGIIFGLMHAGYDDPYPSTLHAWVSALLVQAPLYHFYGLTASLFAHIVSHTLAVTFLYLKSQQNNF